MHRSECHKRYVKRCYGSTVINESTNMKLLRIVTTFDAKTQFEAARQTNYISLDELESGKKIPLKPSGKVVTGITIELVDKEEREKRVKEMEKDLGD